MNQLTDHSKYYIYLFPFTFSDFLPLSLFFMALFPPSTTGEGGEGTGPGAGSGVGGSKSRRRRTAFTSEQLMELEREFQTKKYLTLSERSHIAQTLSLSEVSITSLYLSFFFSLSFVLSL